MFCFQNSITKLFVLSIIITTISGCGIGPSSLAPSSTKTSENTENASNDLPTKETSNSQEVNPPIEADRSLEITNSFDLLKKQSDDQEKTAAPSQQPAHQDNSTQYTTQNTQQYTRQSSPPQYIQTPKQERNSKKSDKRSRIDPEDASSSR